MIVTFTPIAWEQYIDWQLEDRKIIKKINELIKDISRTPFEGIGKPEPLKHNLKGFWSRRITGEHRIIYEIDGDYMNIVSCKFHYL
jgi:toxin YoeB